MPAITRDSSPLGVRLWISANSGTTKKPANRPMPTRSTTMRQLPGALQECRDGGHLHRRRAAAREVQIDHEGADAERAQRHQADFHRARRQLLAQDRSHAGADREQRQREDVEARAGNRPGWRRRSPAGCEVSTVPTNQNHDTPSTALRTAGCLRVSRQIASDSGSGFQLMRQLRRAGFHARDGAADQIAGHRQRDHRHRRRHRSMRAGHGEDQSAEQHADEDRDRRAHLDQAVAAGEFLRLEHRGQDRILHRPEQRRLHAGGRTARPAAPPCSA